LIEIGAVREDEIPVDDRVAIRFLGLDGARVYGTPFMIGNMEGCCRNLLHPMLDAGYDSVGTEVNIKHLAAAPMGSTVTVRAEILSVEGRRVKFAVEARDAKEKIGEGTHERAIIHVERFAEKMQKKLAPAP
jgi:predicted thioesterase